MRKKKSVKVKPQSKRKVPEKKTKKENEEPEVLPFHKFFPLTLIHKNDKQEKVCYFVCQEHLDKYVARYKLKKKDYKVSKTKRRESTSSIKDKKINPNILSPKPK